MTLYIFLIFSILFIFFESFVIGIVHKRYGKSALFSLERLIRWYLFIMYFVAPVVKYFENLFYEKNDSYFRSIEFTWLYVFICILFTYLLENVKFNIKKNEISSNYSRFFKILLLLYLLQFIILIVSEIFSFELYEQINFLGGVKSKGLLGGLYLTLKSLNYWCYVLAFVPTKNVLKPLNSKFFNLVFYLLALDLFWSSFFSGWKGQIVFLFIPWLIKYFIETKKFPIKSLAVLILSYLFIIEPAVQITRMYNAVSKDVINASTFKSAIDNFDPVNSEYDHSLMGLFRGLVPMANTIMEKSDFGQGFLRSNTVVWGLESAIPRILYPSKPDQDIGNYLMKYVGNFYDSEVYNFDNTDFNVAVHLFFEFVANYGIIGGVILSFAALFLLALFPVFRGNEFEIFSFVLFFKLVLLLESPLGGILGVLTREWLLLFVVFFFAKINFNVALNNYTNKK